jgi:geranylgeranyl diphosphate/geranylgeranyl-bacteriochlorophyllide a reductase
MKRRVLIVGGSVGGATAASTLLAAGVDVVIVEKELSKAKPCGGAVPPCAFREWNIPETLIDRKVHNCLVVSPSGRTTNIAVAGTQPSSEDYVAMVRREVFDGYLRERAQHQGAELLHGSLESLAVAEDGVRATWRDGAGDVREVRADAVIGADGAYSTVAKQLGLAPVPRAVAIQERIALPPAKMARWLDTADLYLGRDTSPDLYAWVFPKKDHVAVGIGAGPNHTKAAKQLLANLKARVADDLAGGSVILREAHALPMHPRKQLAYERAVLIGDAAGLVAHTSGEGIYWAMKSGQIAAEVLAECITHPTQQHLRAYERRWWQQYGTMYRFLEWLQWWGYGNERQMEVFTDMCANHDVQRLTFDSYMHKSMAPAPWLVQLAMTRDIIGAQLRHYLRRPSSQGAKLPQTA